MWGIPEFYFEILVASWFAWAIYFLIFGFSNFFMFFVTGWGLDIQMGRAIHRDLAQPIDVENPEVTSKFGKLIIGTILGGVAASLALAGFIVFVTISEVPLENESRALLAIVPMQLVSLFVNVGIGFMVARNKTDKTAQHTSRNILVLILLVALIGPLLLLYFVYLLIGVLSNIYLLLATPADLRKLYKNLYADSRLAKLTVTTPSPQQPTEDDESPIPDESLPADVSADDFVSEFADEAPDYQSRAQISQQENYMLVLSEPAYRAGRYGGVMVRFWERFLSVLAVILFFSWQFPDRFDAAITQYVVLAGILLFGNYGFAILLLYQRRPDPTQKRWINPVAFTGALIIILAFYIAILLGEANTTISYIGAVLLSVSVLWYFGFDSRTEATIEERDFFRESYAPDVGVNAQTQLTIIALSFLALFSALYAVTPTDLSAQWVAAMVALLVSVFFFIFLYNLLGQDVIEEDSWQWTRGDGDFQIDSSQIILSSFAYFLLQLQPIFLAGGLVRYGVSSEAMVYSWQASLVATIILVSILLLACLRVWAANILAKRLKLADQQPQVKYPEYRDLLAASALPYCVLIPALLFCIFHIYGWFPINRLVGLQEDTQIFNLLIYGAIGYGLMWIFIQIPYRRGVQDSDYPEFLRLKQYIENLREGIEVRHGWSVVTDINHLESGKTSDTVTLALQNIGDEMTLQRLNDEIKKAEPKRSYRLSTPNFADPSLDSIFALGFTLILTAITSAQQQIVELLLK
jgi:hypothetical protein